MLALYLLLFLQGLLHRLQVQTRQTQVVQIFLRPVAMKTQAHLVEYLHSVFARLLVMQEVNVVWIHHGMKAQEVNVVWIYHGMKAPPVDGEHHHAEMAYSKARAAM